MVTGMVSKYTPMDDPKELKGLWTIRWNDEAKSLLAIVQRAHNWHIAIFVNELDLFDLGTQNYSENSN